MRLDYISYAVAIIFFIVTLAAAAYSFEQQQLWIVTTAVIGLAFIGLGYTQRPKPKATAPATNVPPPPPSPPPRPIVTEVVKPEEIEPVVQPQPPAGGLTEVKGIGEKRAAQLKALGINSIEDLAKGSAKDLATKLNISPKITNRWIENAKEIGQKP